MSSEYSEEIRQASSPLSVESNESLSRFSDKGQRTDGISANLSFDHIVEDVGIEQGHATKITIPAICGVLENFSSRVPSA